MAVIGLVVATLAILALAMPGCGGRGAMTAVGGLAVFVAPWIFGYADDRAGWTSWIQGRRRGRSPLLAVPESIEEYRRQHRAAGPHRPTICAPGMVTGPEWCVEGFPGRRAVAWGSHPPKRWPCLFAPARSRPQAMTDEEFPVADHRSSPTLTFQCFPSKKAILSPLLEERGIGDVLDDLRVRPRIGGAEEAPAGQLGAGQRSRGFPQAGVAGRVAEPVIRAEPRVLEPTGGTGAVGAPWRS